jgi:hypothetical protein
MGDRIRIGVNWVFVYLIYLVLYKNTEVYIVGVNGNWIVTGT